MCSKAYWVIYSMNETNFSESARLPAPLLNWGEEFSLPSIMPAQISGPLHQQEPQDRCGALLYFTRQLSLAVIEAGSCHGKEPKITQTAGQGGVTGPGSGLKIKTPGTLSRLSLPVVAS